MKGGGDGDGGRRRRGDERTGGHGGGGISAEAACAAACDVGPGFRNLWSRYAPELLRGEHPQLTGSSWNTF